MSKKKWSPRFIGTFVSSLNPKGVKVFYFTGKRKSAKLTLSGKPEYVRELYTPKGYYRVSEKLIARRKK